MNLTLKFKANSEMKLENGSWTEESAVAVHVPQLYIHCHVLSRGCVGGCHVQQVLVAKLGYETTDPPLLEDLRGVTIVWLSRGLVTSCPKGTGMHVKATSDLIFYRQGWEGACDCTCSV